MKFTRSISVDLFLSQQHKQKYQKHLQKIQQIKHHKQNHQKSIQQVKKISKKLKIARQRARSFKHKQDNYHRQKTDLKMYRNIQEMGTNIQLRKKQGRYEMKQRKNSGEKSIGEHKRQNNQDSIKKNKGQKSLQKPISLIKQYLITEQNQKLAQNIKSYQVNTKNYKKKIATQISQYLKLREHMQRFKTHNKQPSNQKSIKTQRSNVHTSQRSLKKYGTVNPNNQFQKQLHIKNVQEILNNKNHQTKNKLKLRIKTQNLLAPFMASSRVPLQNLQQYTKQDLEKSREQQFTQKIII